MGLRIERKLDESITITEPDGSSVILTRHPDYIAVVDWRQGVRKSRNLPIHLTSICPVGKLTTLRVQPSRRGEAYLSFLLNAPQNVVISRTEEPRANRRPANGW